MLTRRAVSSFLLILSALATKLLLSTQARAQPRVLDACDDPTRWTVINAEGVVSSLTSDRGADGSDAGALRFEYDFTRGSGYCIIRQEVNLPLPANYRFGFSLRGQGPRNSLEFKLLDPTGDNVWWVNQRAIEFPPDWSEQRLPARRFTFAWGPAGGDRPLTQVKWIEIAIAATSGGKGTLWLDDLTFEPLPVTKPYDGTPRITAGSGTLASTSDLSKLDWTPGDSTDHVNAHEITIDFGVPRELGGLALRFQESAHGFSFDLRAAHSEAELAESRPVHASGPASGGLRHVRLPDLEARYLRLRLAPLPGQTGQALPTLRAIDAMPIDEGASMNAFLRRVAADAPPGLYPRQFHGKATYFTVVGVSGDHSEALIDELGAVEIDKLGFSIEPFVRRRSADGGTELTRTWADAHITQSLADGYLPIPTVRRSWEDDDLNLDITAFASGTAGDSLLNVGYTITNLAGDSGDVRLTLAVRPFQVNPPYQNLNIEGGVSTITRIERIPSGLLVNAARRLAVISPATSIGLCRFHEGEAAHRALRDRLPSDAPPGEAITDPTALASAAIVYDLTIPSRSSRTVWLASPFHPNAAAPSPRTAAQLRPAPDLDSAADVWRESLAAAQERWTIDLNRTGLRLPNIGNAQRLWDIARTTLAYILINRDGPAIQPGSRCYERTWIRDGSLTSTALLGLDHTAEVRAFLEWFAPFQYPSGKVPCCADSRGPDPVPEHDSHGQFIYAIAEYHRFTGDTAFVESMWDRVAAAVKYIEFLRAQRMTDEYRADPAKRPFFGVLPESISHEGYSAKPMHSYWDSLFALRGLKDAVYLANTLGKAVDAARYQALADDFRDTLYASMRLSMEAKGIDYIPGCVELGDFDATSTTIGVFPVNELGRLPEPALANTFEKYWTFFQDRAYGPASTTWDGYTPYELRVLGTFVCLGQRERAHAALDWFLTHQRPAAWNHWAEVVWRDRTKVGYVGDMPHTWVGSDFLNSLRSFFVYERTSDDALVLMSGVPKAWLLSSDGLAVIKWPTHHGVLSYGSSAERGVATIVVPAGALLPPPGGVVIQPPNPESITAARVNGSAIDLEALAASRELRLPALPATVELTYAP